MHNTDWFQMHMALEFIHRKNESAIIDFFFLLNPQSAFALLILENWKFYSNIDINEFIEDLTHALHTSVHNFCSHAPLNTKYHNRN